MKFARRGKQIRFRKRDPLLPGPCQYGSGRDHTCDDIASWFSVTYEDGNVRRYRWCPQALKDRAAMFRRHGLQIGKVEAL